MKIKNHVSKKAKRISGMLKGKFGFDLALVNQALQGNKAALQAIGEAARQGQQVLELMPLLKDACTTIEKATEEYNKGVADILKQGATSAINTDKAIMQTMLANQKYVHQRSELAAEFSVAKSTESARHQYAINYIQLKAYIDQYLTKVDNDAKLLDQTNRPELKQFDENNRYDMAVSRHLLQHGDKARVDLIPKREYTTTTENRPEGKTVVTVQERLAKSFGSLLSGLGF